MNRRTLTPAGRALEAHLRRSGKSLTAFCAEHELDRIQVARAMKGKLQRVSVDLAYAIHRASKGAVGWDLWRSELAKKAA